jgi:hypothetical protein
LTVVIPPPGRREEPNAALHQASELPDRLPRDLRVPDDLSSVLDAVETHPSDLADYGRHDAREILVSHPHSE